MLLVAVEMLRHCVVWRVELCTPGGMVTTANWEEVEMKVCVCMFCSILKVMHEVLLGHQGCVIYHQNRAVTVLVKL